MNDRPTTYAILNGLKYSIEILAELEDPFGVDNNIKTVRVMVLNSTKDVITIPKNLIFKGYL